MVTDGIIFRACEPNDIPEIERIYKEYHEGTFSVLNPDSCIGSIVATKEDGSLITFGSLHILGEAVIIQNMEKDVKTRLEVLDKLLNEAIDAAKSARLRQLHIFVKDPEFAKLLIKHFKFKMITDVPLVLNL